MMETKEEDQKVSIVSGLDVLLEAIEKRENKIREMKTCLDMIKKMDENRKQNREERLKRLMKIEQNISDSKMKTKVHKNSKIELKI